MESKGSPVPGQKRPLDRRLKRSGGVRAPCTCSNVLTERPGGSLAALPSTSVTASRWGCKRASNCLGSARFRRPLKQPVADASKGRERTLVRSGQGFDVRADWRGQETCSDAHFGGGARDADRNSLRLSHHPKSAAELSPALVLSRVDRMRPCPASFAS